MEEMTGRLEDKREQMKKETIGGGDSLAGTPLEDYLVGQMGNMIDSIGKDWKEIGGDRKSGTSRKGEEKTDYGP